MSCLAPLCSVIPILRSHAYVTCPSNTAGDGGGTPHPAHDRPNPTSPHPYPRLYRPCVFPKSCVSNGRNVFSLAMYVYRQKEHSRLMRVLVSTAIAETAVGADRYILPPAMPSNRTPVVSPLCKQSGCCTAPPGGLRRERLKRGRGDRWRGMSTRSQQPVSPRAELDPGARGIAFSCRPSYSVLLGYPSRTRGALCVLVYSFFA